MVFGPATKKDIEDFHAATKAHDNHEGFEVCGVYFETEEVMEALDWDEPPKGMEEHIVFGMAAIIDAAGRMARASLLAGGEPSCACAGCEKLLLGGDVRGFLAQMPIAVLDKEALKKAGATLPCMVSPICEDCGEGTLRQIVERVVSRSPRNRDFFEMTKKDAQQIARAKGGKFDA